MQEMGFLSPELRHVQNWNCNYVAWVATTCIFQWVVFPHWTSRTLRAQWLSTIPNEWIPFSNLDLLNQSSGIKNTICRSIVVALHHITILSFDSTETKHQNHIVSSYSASVFCFYFYLLLVSHLWRTNGSLPLHFFGIVKMHMMVGQYLDAFSGLWWHGQLLIYPFLFVLRLWPLDSSIWSFFSCSLVNQHPLCLLKTCTLFQM